MNLTRRLQNNNKAISGHNSPHKTQMKLPFSQHTDENIHNLFQINKSLPLTQNTVHGKFQKNNNPALQPIFAPRARIYSNDNKINAQLHHKRKEFHTTSLSKNKTKFQDKELLEINTQQQSPFLAKKSDQTRKFTLLDNHLDTQYHKGKTQFAHPQTPKLAPLQSQIKQIEQKSNSLLDPGFEYVLRYAVKTRKGMIPSQPGKINQDSFIIYPNIQQKSFQHFFCICDGHGQYGHFVSQYLKQLFPLLLEHYGETLADKSIFGSKNNKNNNQSKMLQLFKDADNYLSFDSQIDLSFSGSTCVGVYLYHNLLICPNVGDSRAVIVRKKNINNQQLKHNDFQNDTYKDDQSIQDQDFEVVELSQDHKPSIPYEANRIYQSGGRIQKYKDQQGNELGPLRVWIEKEDIPGLAMTRSFGDKVAESVGVIAVPEILEYWLSSDDKIIVLGSDGVWEFISSQECMELLWEFYLNNDLEGGSEALHNLAVTRWQENSSVIDDITFVLIFLNYD